MKKKALSATNISSLSLGGTVDAETLTAITEALKPHWDGLTEAQQQEAKVLAASMMLGNQGAAETLRERILIWFPFPIQPFPPIIWEAEQPPFAISSVAIGLIIIGIGIMLL